MIKKILYWSFSLYELYCLCPRKAKLRAIDKIKEPQSPPLLRGNRVHTNAAKFITGKTKALDEALAKHYGKLFRRLRAAYKKDPSRFLVEYGICYTKDWKLTKGTDFKNCWLRTAIDLGEFNAAHTAIKIRDWKTGKVREYKFQDAVEQLELYAMVLFKRFPKLNKIEACLPYVDAGKTFPDDFPDEDPIIFHRKKHYTKLQKTWEKRIAPMFADRVFPPCPNNLCGYCFHSQTERCEY